MGNAAAACIRRRPDDSTAADVDMGSYWETGSLETQFLNRVRAEARRSRLLGAMGSVDKITTREMLVLPHAVQAARAGDLDCLCRLSSMLGVDEIDPANGRTLLLHAVDAQQTESVRTLLQRGANIDAVDYGGQTVFHLAVNHDNESTARVLISFAQPGAGRRVHRAAQNGRTPLHYCAAANKILMAELLISTMREVPEEVYSNWHDHSHQTPARVAKARGFKMLSMYLQQAVADLSTPRIGKFHPHSDARSQHPAYPERARVPDAMLPWSVAWPEYDPPQFTHPIVRENSKVEVPVQLVETDGHVILSKGWADPEDPEVGRATERTQRANRYGET